MDDPITNVAAENPPATKSWLRKHTYTPILFVIFTLIAWYLFQLLARIVITCLPGGDSCQLRPGRWLLNVESLFSADERGPYPPVYLYGKPYLDALVSVVMLIFAVWAISRLLFPPDDFSSSSSQEQ